MIDVVAMGLVSPLGKDKHTGWQNLLAGYCPIKIQQPFAHLPPMPLALIANRPSDPTTLLLTALTEALQESGWQLPLEDCGVVIGSSRGEQALWEQWLTGQRQDLQTWLAHLPGSFARTVAAKVGANRWVAAPMAACATAMWAVAIGMEWLRQGQCARVIVGAVDAAITPLTLAGFMQMGALAKEGCFPFDRKRQGLVLGEAAGVILLEKPSHAQKKYGSILGWGCTCDAENPVIPGADMTAALTAIQNCFQCSHVTLNDCHAVHTHGTGTRRNDDREMQMIHHCFPKPVYLLATKGATGHTLGAAGMVNIIFSLLALREQVLPPCVGLSDPDFGGNFVRVKRQAKCNAILNLSFGFGGQNGAILVGNAAG
ncbi:MAG: beta-ketoacyl-ACP synthase [Gloeomargarita sp. DG_2_bins_126]